MFFYESLKQFQQQSKFVKKHVKHFKDRVKFGGNKYVSKSSKIWFWAFKIKVK